MTAQAVVRRPHGSARRAARGPAPKVRLPGRPASEPHRAFDKSDVRAAQTLGFSLAEIARTGEELRGVPDAAEALSALFEEKIKLVDTRMSELATLRAELTERVGTGCPLRTVDPDEDGVGSMTGRLLTKALRPVN
jgi:MerR-like DNA binding protein